MFVHTDCLDIGLQAAAEAGISRERILILNDAVADGIDSWESLLADKPMEMPGLQEQLKTDWSKQLAYLMYSSGTTSAAKGVMLSHTNVVANVIQAVNHHRKDLLPNAVFGGCLPFYHI